jgi:hypothetical protein
MAVDDWPVDFVVFDPRDLLVYGLLGVAFSGFLVSVTKSRLHAAWTCRKNQVPDEHIVHAR